MTSPLSGNPGQTGPGLTPNGQDTAFGTDAALDKRDRNGPRQEDMQDLAATFAMQLAGARAKAAVDFTQDDSDIVVVAAPPPPPLPLMFDGADVQEVERKAARPEIAALAETLRAEVNRADQLRLGSSTPVALTLPIKSAALGLTEAKLTVSKGELSVVFPLPQGADAAVVNAALGDLAMALSQRFPNRTIRLRSEDDRDPVDPAEFNPFKQPVGRVK